MTEQPSIDLGPVGFFTAGEFKRIRVGRREIGVIRLADDRVFAVGGTLLPSHPDRLAYGLEDEVVCCPWHGYEFSLRTGDCLFTGGRMRLRTYDVELRDGNVHVVGLADERDGSDEGGAP